MNIVLIKVLSWNVIIFCKESSLLLHSSLFCSLFIHLYLFTALTFFLGLMFGLTVFFFFFYINANGVCESEKRGRKRSWERISSCKTKYDERAIEMVAYRVYNVGELREKQMIFLSSYTIKSNRIDMVGVFIGLSANNRYDRD